MALRSLLHRSALPFQATLRRHHSILSPPRSLRSLRPWLPQQQRLLRWSRDVPPSWPRGLSAASAGLDPYDTLGVERTASGKEIKLAYFAAAKRSHPDLNPGDSTAQVRFQAVADAYEVLSDPIKRREYDRVGAGQDAGSFSQSQRRGGFGGQQQQQQQHATAHETWARATADTDVIRQAMADYGDELYDDASLAMTRAQAGDFGELREFASRNKGVILGVVLPLFAVLRFPGAVFGVLRLLPTFGYFALMGLATLSRLVGPRYVTHLTSGLFAKTWGSIVGAARCRVRQRSGRVDKDRANRERAARRSADRARQRQRSKRR